MNGLVAVLFALDEIDRHRFAVRRLCAFDRGWRSEDLASPPATNRHGFAVKGECETMNAGWRNFDCVG